MFKIKYLSFFPIALLLISCSGSDVEGVSIIEASVTSSNDTPSYNETYTISWESNASQCFATSSSGSWLGELAPSGSQDFIAKREGTANYGVQCRTSINFVNASTDVVVLKDFNNYLDFEDASVFELGSLVLDSESSLAVLDNTIADFNGDFLLDLVVLLEESRKDNSEDTNYYILAFYGQDTSTITSESPYIIKDINSEDCVANELIRADYNEDGLLDIMSVSSSSEKSLNKRGMCFFIASQDGLTLQEDNYIINETNLDLSNVDIGSHVSYDINANFRPDILLFGNGGSTDLPFYVVPSEEGPFIQLSNPLDALNPYSRANGCFQEITFLCDWKDKDLQFEESTLLNADGDGILDILHSINTTNGPTYILNNTRLEDIYFDWSFSTEDYITTSISSGDGIALKMTFADGNIDGFPDLFVFEKSYLNETYKLSIYEKNISEEDSINEISRTNNGDFPNEYSFSNSLKFTKDFLLFDLDFSGYADIWIPYTELPFLEGGLGSDKHFLAFEKSYIVNEDASNTQEWIMQDFSESIGLDNNSVSNSWIDFDLDNDIDVILMIPEVSTDGLSINYNFRLYLNNSLF